MATYQERMAHSLGLLGRISTSQRAARQQTPYYKAFAANAAADWNRNKAAYAAGAQQALEDQGGEDGWDKFWRPVESVLNALTAGGSGVMNTIDKQIEVGKSIATSEDWAGEMGKTLVANAVGGVFVPTSAQRQFWDGFVASWNSDTKSQNYMTGSKLIESATDRFGSVDRDYVDVEDNVNPWVKGIGGFVADVGLDPLTYAPGGIIASGLRGSRAAVKAAEGSDKFGAALKGVATGGGDNYAVGYFSKQPKPVGTQQWLEVRQYNKVDRLARQAGINTGDLFDVADDLARGGSDELARVGRDTGLDDETILDVLGKAGPSLPSARKIFDGTYLIAAEKGSPLGVRNRAATATLPAAGISAWRHPQEAATAREAAEETVEQAPEAAAPAAQPPTPESLLDDAVESGRIAEEAATPEGSQALAAEAAEVAERARVDAAERRRAQSVDAAARTYDDDAATGVPWHRETTRHARESRAARQARAVQGARALTARRLLENGRLRQAARVENVARGVAGTRLQYRAVDGELKPFDRVLPVFSGPQRVFLAAQLDRLPPYRTDAAGKVLFDRGDIAYDEWAQTIDTGIGAARRSTATRPVSERLSAAFQKHANAGSAPDMAWQRALQEVGAESSVLFRSLDDYGEAIGDVLEGAKMQGGPQKLWAWFSHGKKRAYDERYLAQLAEKMGISVLDIPAEEPMVDYIRKRGAAVYSEATRAVQTHLEAVREATVVGGEKIQRLSKTQSPAAGIRELHEAHTAELAAFLTEKGVPASEIEKIAVAMEDEAAAIVVDTISYSGGKGAKQTFESDAGFETAIIANEGRTTGENAVHTRVVNNHSEGVNAARRARAWVDQLGSEFSDTAKVQLYQHMMGEVQLQMQRLGVVARADISRASKRFVDDDLPRDRQWSFLAVADVMRSIDLELLTDLMYSSRVAVQRNGKTSEISFPPSVLPEAGTLALKLREAKVPVDGSLTQFRPLTQHEMADILSVFIREAVRTTDQQGQLFQKNWVESQSELAESLMDQLAVALTLPKTLQRLELSNSRNGAIAYSFGKAGANLITEPVKRALDEMVAQAGRGMHNGKVAAEFNKAFDRLRRALAKEAEQTGLTKDDLEWMISEQDVSRYAALHMAPAAAAFGRLQTRMQNATMRDAKGARIPEERIEAQADRMAGAKPQKSAGRTAALRQNRIAAMHEHIAVNKELESQVAEQRMAEIESIADPLEQAEAAMHADQALLTDAARLHEHVVRGTQGVETDALADMTARVQKQANDAEAGEAANRATPPETVDEMVAVYGDQWVTPQQANRIEEAVLNYRATLSPGTTRKAQIQGERKRAAAALHAARVADGTLPIQGKTQAVWLAKIMGELATKGALRYTVIGKQFRAENVGGWTSRELDVLVSRKLAEYVTDKNGTRVGLRSLVPAEGAGEAMTRLVRDPHLRTDADLADEATRLEDAQRMADPTEPVVPADAAAARRGERPTLSDHQREMAAEAGMRAGDAQAQEDAAALAAQQEQRLLTGEAVNPAAEADTVQLNAGPVGAGTKWAERLSGQHNLADVKSDLAMRQIRAQDVSSNYEHFLERDVVQALMREQDLTLQQAADLLDTWFLQLARAGSDENMLRWLEQFADGPLAVIAGNFHKAVSLIFQHGAATSLWARTGLNSNHVRRFVKMSPLGTTPSAWVAGDLNGWEVAKFWTDEKSFLRYIGGDPELNQFRAVDLLKGYNWALHQAGIAPTIAADFINKFGHEALGFPKSLSAAEAKRHGLVKFTGTGGIGEWLDGVDVYFPRQLQAQMEAAERFIDYVRTLPQNELGKLIRLSDKVVGVLKASLTLWRPGHHVVNIMGEYLMNLLSGVNNPARYAEAFAVMRAGGEWKRGTVFGHNGLKDIEMFAAEYGFDGVQDGTRTLSARIGGKTREISLAQAYQFLDRAGLLINHNTAEDIVSIADDVMHANGRFDGKFGAIVRANRGLGEFAARRDNVFRVAHALDILQKRGFRSWEEAADHLRKVIYEAHPTMQTLSGFEQKVMRRIFYFYTWQRQALTMVLKSVLERPGALTIPAKLNYELATIGGEPQSIGQPMPDDERLPSFAAGNILGPHWFDEEGNIHSLSINAPQLDILQSFFGNMRFNPDQDLASNMRDNGFNFLRENTIGWASPMLKMPTELISGTQYRGSGLSQEMGDPWDYTVDQTGLGYISRITGRNLYNQDGWFGYRADVLDDDSPAEQERRANEVGTNWGSGLRFSEPSRYAGSAEFERKAEEERIAEDSQRNVLGNSPERVIDPVTGEYLQP